MLSFWITHPEGSVLFQAPGRVSEPDPLRDALQQMNPDNLSPREALELLYRLKSLG